MKRAIVVAIALLLGATHLASGHEEQTPGSGHMMGRGMMGYDMMGYGMMGDEGCPMMMNMARSVDYLLTYRYGLELSKTQVAQLKEIRDSYQKDAVTLCSDLNMEMLKLNNLLSDEELNIVQIKATNKRIGEIESELRNKNIETFKSAKMMLTREQFKKAKEMGLFDMSEMYGSQGMMMR